MSIKLNDSIRVQGGKPVEDKRLNNGVVYTSVSQANTLINKTDRYQTLEVAIRIGGVTFIYWYKEGIEDSDLVLKQDGGGGGGTIPSVMVFKDTVPTYNDLLAVTGQEQGWVYGVVSQGKLYVWIEDYAGIAGNNIWKDMGVTVDFSNYYTRTEVDNLLDDYVVSDFLNANFYTKQQVNDNFLSKTNSADQTVESNVKFKKGSVSVSNNTNTSISERIGKLVYNGLNFNDTTSNHLFTLRLSELTEDRNITFPDKSGTLLVESDLSSYYTSAQTDTAITSKGYITSSSLTGYATENWVTTQTTPATQVEVEASTGTESQPLSAEPATENRKYLSLFNFFKLIKKLRYIHLLPNSATAVANRLRSDGSKLFYANNSAVEKEIAYVNDVATLLQQPIKFISTNTTVDNSFHNAIVVFLANVTLTIPAGLRSDMNFSCFAKNTAIASFVAGSGVTLFSPFGLILRDNAMGTIFPDSSANSYVINGGFLPA